MSNSRDILNTLVSENLVEAKKLINEALFARLGNSLEEKLVDYAPSVFNNAAKEVKESAEVSDEMLIEEFENEIAQIVHEIQEETGEELTDEEIQEIAEEYLQILESTEE